MWRYRAVVTHPIHPQLLHTYRNAGVLELDYYFARRRTVISWASPGRCVQNRTGFLLGIGGIIRQSTRVCAVLFTPFRL